MRRALAAFILLIVLLIAGSAAAAIPRDLAKLTEDIGAKFDIRAFHDRILSEGQLPLDILESRINGWVRDSLAGSR